MVLPRSPRVLVYAGLALAVLAAATLAAACGGAEPEVDFSRHEPVRAGAAGAAPSGPTLRMAVAPVLSAAPTSDLYQRLADYLGDKLGQPVQLVLGKTYAEINDLIKSGDVSLALVCTNPYLQGRDDFGMELLVVPQINGETVYYSLLISGRDVEATSLGDLRGSTFAFSDPMSNSGRLAPLYELARLEESPDAFFERTIFTYSHDSSIRAVAEGVVTAAAVDSLVFDYMAITEPDLIAQVKVIEEWGPYGINPVVVHPRLDPALKEQLRQAFLDMDDDPDGRRILPSLMIDRFVPGDDSAYDSVREMRSFMRDSGLEP